MVTYVDIRSSARGPSQSLRRHLAQGFGLFTLLLSAGISVYVAHVVNEAATRQIASRLTDVADEIRDRLDRAMFERFRALRVLASPEGGIAAPEAAGSRRARLEDVHRERSAFAWIGYADASGRVLAGTGGAFEGDDVSAQPWFKGGLQDIVVQEVHEAPAWPKRAGRPDGAAPRVVTVGMPVRDAAGRVAGVLGAYLDWGSFFELRPPLAGDIKLLVLSRDAVVLHGIEALQGRKLDLQAAAGTGPGRRRWSVEKWPDGDRYFTAVSATRGHAGYPQLGWTVVLRRDAGDVLEDVARLQMQIIGAGALLGLAFAVLAWWFAARVAAPLVTIADAADRLSAGDRDAAIPAVTGYAEVERLAVSLRAMLANLRRQEEDLLQARDKLELRVRERAAELTRTQAELVASVAEREHAQREAVRAKERLDLALDAAAVAVWTYDLASGRVELSEQWAAMLGGARGVTVTTLDDMTFLVPEEERARVREAIAAAAGGATDSYVVRHHVQRANGALLLTESRGRVVERGADGAALRMAGTVRALEATGSAPPPRARHGS